MFRRSDSGVNQVKSKDLYIFLKDSKRAKEKLKSEHPDEFDHFQMILNIRIAFLALMCSFGNVDCKHPLCQLGQPQETIT